MLEAHVLLFLSTRNHQLALLHRHGGQAWQVLNEPDVPGEVCVDVAASPLFHFPGYIKCVREKSLAIKLGSKPPFSFCPSASVPSSTVLVYPMRPNQH